MFIIKCFNRILESESEYICDVVENYDALITYFNKLVEGNRDLKWVQSAPMNSRVGLLIPVLHSKDIDYYFERYEFVTEPSKV